MGLSFVYRKRLESSSSSSSSSTKSGDGHVMGDGIGVVSSFFL